MSMSSLESSGSNVYPFVGQRELNGGDAVIRYPLPAIESAGTAAGGYHEDYALIALPDGLDATAMTFVVGLAKGDGTSPPRLFASHEGQLVILDGSVQLAALRSRIGGYCLAKGELSVCIGDNCSYAENSEAWIRYCKRGGTIFAFAEVIPGEGIRIGNTQGRVSVYANWGGAFLGERVIGSRGSQDANEAHKVIAWPSKSIS
ncbi:MAG TPA: hypothetical protein VF261_00665 [Candidatus Saccharimonadales bacterium]